jgi:DNA mismatch endonuclease (patch repair protein)
VQRLIAVGDISVRPDVVFGPAKTAVFLDACFWHGCPEHGNRPTTNAWYWEPKLERNRRRDETVDEALTLAGWSVVRIWEHEAPSEGVAKVVAALGRGA